MAKRTRPHLFLKEHREHKNVSDRKMAERLGIERMGVWRLEKHYDLLDLSQLLKWAEALGVEPQDLWRSPKVPSVDAMLAGAPDDVRALVLDLVRRLISK